jgi:hypothetical protein
LLENYKLSGSSPEALWELLAVGGISILLTMMYNLFFLLTGDPGREM